MPLPLRSPRICAPKSPSAPTKSGSRRALVMDVISTTGFERSANLQVSQLAGQARPRPNRKKIMSTSITKKLAGKLAGKVALVTGGSRSIGAAIAKRLATDGAAVDLTYSASPGQADEVVRSIEGPGGKAVALKADAGDTRAGPLGGAKTRR